MEFSKHLIRNSSLVWLTFMLILIDHQSEQKILNQGQALAKQQAGEENSWINSGVLHSER